MGFTRFIVAVLPALALPASGASPLHAAPGQFEVRVRPAPQPRNAVPVVVSSPEASLGRVIGSPGFGKNARALVTEGSRAVPAQTERRDGKIRITWLAPGITSPGQERVFDVRLVPAAPGAPNSVVGGPVVSETPEAVTVATPYLRVVHPRSANGGLPSSITFLPDGGTFTGFQLNDRLYRLEDKRGFLLRYDRRPEVVVESTGPVCTVVRVRARYVAQDGAAPDSHPEATYRFIYYAGLPIFQVEGDVAQEKPVPWYELHFLEWNFHTPFFTHWALSPSIAAAPRVQAFTATQKGQSEPGWGALVNAKVALAMAAGHHMIYDDLEGYGRYLHGPWAYDWEGGPRHFAATLYAGPGSPEPEALRAAVAPYFSEGGSAAVTLRIPTLEARLARAGKEVPAGDVMGRWLLHLAANAARSPETLADAASLLQQIEARRVSAGTRPGRRRGRRPTPRLAAPVTGGIAVTELPNLLLTTDGVLGLGFRKEGEGWRLFSLYHARANHEFLESLSGPVPLWQARLRDKDSSVSQSVVGGPARLRIDRSRLPKELNLQLTWAGEPAVKASVVLRAGRGVSIWRASAEKPGIGRGVWEFDFPVLSGLGSREHPEQDVVAVPWSWGKLYPNPRATLTSMGADYPSGRWSMQYALLYHGGHGLYLGTQDPRARAKRFQMRYEGDSSGGQVVYTVTHYPPDMGKPGIGCELPFDTAIGVFDGDWYEGSRLYRRWAMTAPWTAKGPLGRRTDVGSAIRPLALWMQGGGPPQSFVPEVKRFQDFFGVPMGVHWYNWHEIPFDVHYPDYFPTKPGFHEGVAELRARGVVVMPYINGRLWDTANEDWPPAKASSAMRPDGANYVETYGSGAKLAPMCPTTPAWQAKVKEIVLRLVREEGVSGVYIDQITAAAPARCFNPEHGHPLGGGDYWWTGYRKLLGDIRAEMARTNPSAFLTSENNAEPWIDVLDGHLTWVPPLGNMAPLYTAVYGGYTYPYGRALAHEALEDRTAAAMEFATQFLWGGQLGWFGTEILNEKYRPEANYLRELARTRAASIAYLAEGEMLKPPRLITPVPILTGKTGSYEGAIEDRMPAVLTAAWRALDGSVAFFLTNLSTEEQHFTWEIDFAAYRLGKAAKLSPDGARLVGPSVRRVESLPPRSVRVVVARPL